jgi:hypothetical protein
LTSSVYTPPFDSCHLFNETNGKSVSINQSAYFSILGHKVWNRPKWEPY